ncbi:UDP-N-acetylmuramoyl-L-alanyl-D-glutamate--2,6-diaminopimelate ligase [bacterium]|nr:UDP-N-acetylmuramoyl-L-alanyl-D-glutamate--2,6-diaminopimelate ligase [bacterium]
MLIELITPDSRQCGPDTMFVAIPGTSVDGASFIPNAIRAGASCIVAEREHPEVQSVPVIVVPNARQFLSLASQAFFNFPARHLKMVGITGTSGKTSTAYMLRHMLQALNIPSVMIGTTGYFMPDGEVFAPDALPATTPEAFALNWYLDRALKARAKIAVIEVSSFALAFGRVHGMHFDCAVFTNFSEDHLGYHHTMDAYLAAKLSLFASLEQGSIAVLNADDPAFHQFEEAAKGSLVRTFSLSRPASLRGEHVVSTMGKTTFRMSVDNGDPFDVELSVGPAFQASNCLAAVGAFQAIEPARSLEEAIHSLALPLYIPGRYERIDCGQPFEVVVDYAHTPEEFTALFNAVRPYVAGDLLTVFGAVGADDRRKRPIMARLAEEACRWSYVTVEDPRREEASIAVRDIEAGFLTDRFTVIEDRRQAIRSAIGAAKPGDMVLVLGRGHEGVMYYEHEDVPFDDREEVRLALRLLGYTECAGLKTGEASPR